MKTSKSCGALLIEEFKKLIGISKSKTCKNCGAQLADNATFCGECGEKNPIDSAAVNSDTQNTQKKHGHFWNILHYNELEKSAKKKTKKRIIIGTVTLFVAIILIPMLVITVSDFVSSIKPYSYVNTNEFFKSWNTTAENDPNGITDGVKISKKEGYIPITDTVKLYIDTEGRDIRKIEYCDSGYGDQEKAEREKTVNELLSICIPKAEKDDLEKRITEFIESTSDLVPSALKGFSVVFEKADNQNSIKYNINSKYDYSYNIVKSNLPSDGVFNVTLDEFKSNYNKLISEEISNDTLNYWPIKNLKYDDSEYYSGGIEVKHYYYRWILAGKNYATIFVGVDADTGKISFVEYHTLPPSNFNNDTAYDRYTNLLPTCLFRSLDISEYSVSSYLSKAMKASDHKYYNQGITTIAGERIYEDNTSDTLYAMRAGKDNFQTNSASENKESSEAETNEEVQKNEENIQNENF